MHTIHAAASPARPHAPHIRTSLNFPPDCFVFEWTLLTQLTMLVQCIVFAIIYYIPKHCYTPPFTLVMALFGAAFGALGIYADEFYWKTDFTVEFLSSLSVWANVKADAILFVLLPPLLFDAAFNIDFHTFSKILPSAVMLAFPGVILSG